MLVEGVLGFDIALQNGIEVDEEIRGIWGLVWGGVSAFLTTLVIGGILIAFRPTYLERMMQHVRKSPFPSLVYGFLALFLLIAVIIALAITIVGILVAIPLIILAYLIWAIGVTIVLLAIADRFVSHDDGWLKPLLLAALINAILALSGIGGIIAFFAGAIGFGAIMREFIS